MSDAIDKMYAAPKTDVEVAPRGDRSDTIGWVLLAIPPVGGLVCGLAGPDLASILGFVVVVATAIVASIDARRWRVHEPGIWGFVFLWIVFYPRYFHRRVRHGAPPRLAMAIASMFLFFAGAVLGALTMRAAVTRGR